MSIELNTATGVTSGSQIQADLGGHQSLLVLSGIAIPDWQVNDDGHLYFMDINVHLGVYAYRLLQSSVVTALCSIKNDNSSFTFALNNATVTRNTDTGELILSTQNALSGSRTALSRFSYQVVALVEAVQPRISGKISWAASLWNPPSPEPAQIGAQLDIAALAFQAGPGPFGSQVVVAKGRITAVVEEEIITHAHIERFCVASYEIDAPPLFQTLGVTVRPSGVFKEPGRNVGAVQTHGPLQFSLTLDTPEMVCDFSIATFAPIK